MKTKIAVIFGGRSAEHDVSIITAHTPIIESLQALGDFDIYPIYVSKDGSWYSESAMLEMAYFKKPDWEQRVKGLKKLSILFDNGLVLQWGGLFSKSVKIDVVFPSMHGTYGEDGSLMGVLRMAGVPFVGCDLFASAVAMDKVLTKQVVSTANVPVTRYVWFTQFDWESRKEALKKEILELKWPVFVKPVHLGSSIAITKVKLAQELENAIEVALHYDDKILVEESVENLMEITLPIIGNDESRLASLERPLNKTEFFDFADKYLSGGGKKGGGAITQYSEVPAVIDPDLQAIIEDYGRKTYRVLGCTGIARVDFLVDMSDQTVYMNEVNTLPGSLYVHNWKKSGVSNVELIRTLVQLAQERFATTQDITFAFTSDILKQSGSAKTQG